MRRLFLDAKGVDQPVDPSTRFTCRPKSTHTREQNLHPQYVLCKVPEGFGGDVLSPPPPPKK